MIELINIPKQCVVDTEIPLKLIYSQNEMDELSVESVNCYACIKPALIDVIPETTKDIRCEEIQVVLVKANADTDLYKIVKPIYKKIKYHCFIIIDAGYKYKISVCRIKPGKIDYGDNVLNSIIFSSWIYTDILSADAMVLIEKINECLIENELLGMYNGFVDAVKDFQPVYIKRTSSQRLIHDMIGKVSAKRRDEILQYCTMKERHTNLNNSRYNPEYSTTFAFILEEEELWYCFQRCERIKTIIDKRRYRDIRDLRYQIESKSWE